MGSTSWEVSFWRACAFDLVFSFLTWWFLLSVRCNGWLCIGYRPVWWVLYTHNTRQTGRYLSYMMLPWIQALRRNAPARVLVVYTAFLLLDPRFYGFTHGRV